MVEMVSAFISIKSYLSPYKKGVTFIHSYNKMKWHYCFQTRLWKMSFKTLKEKWAALKEKLSSKWNRETNKLWRQKISWGFMTVDEWWRWSLPFVPSNFNLKYFVEISCTLQFHAVSDSEASTSIIRIKVMKRYTHFNSRFWGFLKFLSTCMSTGWFVFAEGFNRG